jgi:hypothetical protein
MSRRPSLFIVGAAKSGTTILWDWLRHHPEINFPKTKEPGYFAFRGGERLFAGAEMDVNYLSTLTRSRQAYDDLYGDMPAEQMAGDASPAYLYFPNSADAIYRFNPAAKIIAIFRDPVARAFSQYRHNRRDGYEPAGTFQQALDLEEGRIKQGWWWGFHYQRAGLYNRQWARFRNRFPAEQCLALRYDDLVASPQSMVSRICRFIDVREYQISDAELRVNDTSRLSHMPANQAIERWFRHSSVLKTRLKAILPRGWRRHLMRQVRRLNRNPAPRLGESVGDHLRSQFRRELIDLSRATSLNLDTWVK